MRKSIEKIKSVSFSDLEKDKDLTLLLLSVYSRLFLNGKAPGTCGKCMGDFYKKIINKGLNIVEFMEKQTLVLKPGLHYVRSENMDFTNNNLTDEKAIKLLSAGLLKPSQFITLPKGYTPKKVKEVKTENKVSSEKK